MNVSLYQAASALNAHARWQDAVSGNLAAASVPGFKKQDLSFSAIQAGVLKAQNSTAKVALPRAQTTTSFTQGEVRQTGVNTDVAIDGEGFFEVQLANGATAFTRDGEFQINAQNELVTKQGYLVQGEGGTIQLDPRNPGPISIAATGEISQGADIKGKIKITEFNDPRLLRQISGGYFLGDNPSLQPSNVAQPSLRQGYLEAANTSPVVEMASLIRIMRGFEANQRLVQIQDDRMGKAISELGSPT